MAKNTDNAFGDGVVPRLVEGFVTDTLPPTPPGKASRPAPKPKRPVRKEPALAAPYGKPAPAPAPVPSAIIPRLAPDVDALAASLGVAKTPGPSGPAYAPDSFVRAVQTIHDTLASVRAALIERQSDLDTREKALRARERAVQAREEAVMGLTALAPIFAAHEAPTRSLWSRLTRR